MSDSLQNDAKKSVQKKHDLRPDFQKDLICQEVLDKLGIVNDLHKISASFLTGTVSFSWFLSDKR